MVVTGSGAGRRRSAGAATSWSRSGRPMPAGRYIHKRDQHPAAIDPNFTGVGRCLTDDDGTYRFTTIKPGPYPWKNHRNAWRPAHIHFSLFGTEFTQRIVTQMYFPGDPLFAFDPIYQSIVDPRARDRLVASYDHDLSVARVVHRLPLGHRAHGQPPHPDRERDGRARMSARDLTATPGQTVGPFFHTPSRFPATASWSAPDAPTPYACTGRCSTVPATLSPTPSSSCGRRTPTAGSAASPGPFDRDGFTFTGFGRAATDDAGHYSFSTVRPGPVVAGCRALLRPDRLRAGAAQPAASPAPTCPRTTRRSVRRPAAVRGRGRAALDAGRRPRLPRASASTSGCRARARPSSSPIRDTDCHGGPALARRRTRRRSLLGRGVAQGDGRRRGRLARGTGVGRRRALECGGAARRPGDVRPARTAGRGGRERRQPRDATGLLAPRALSRTPPPRRRGGCIAG